MGILRCWDSQGNIDLENLTCHPTDEQGFTDCQVWEIFDRNCNKIFNLFSAVPSPQNSNRILDSSNLPVLIRSGVGPRIPAEDSIEPYFRDTLGIYRTLFKSSKRNVKKFHRMDIMVANILKLMQFSMKARKHFQIHIGIKSFCTTKISWFKLDEKVRLNFHKLN